MTYNVFGGTLSLTQSINQPQFLWHGCAPGCCISIITDSLWLHIVGWIAGTKVMVDVSGWCERRGRHVCRLWRGATELSNNDSTQPPVKEHETSSIQVEGEFCSVYSAIGRRSSVAQWSRSLLAWRADGSRRPGFKSRSGREFFSSIGLAGILWD